MTEAIIELQAKRRGWLIVIAGVHVLALVCWRMPQRVPQPPAPPGPGITYILPPFIVPLERPAQPQLAPQLPRLRPTASSARPIDRPAPAPVQLLAPPPPATVTQQPEAIAPSPPSPDPFAQPVKPENNIKQRALLSAAAVDKQLRKEAWNPRDKKIANDKTVLAAAIDSAYIGHDSIITTEEITTPDGRHMTKVHTAAGTFCAQKESNALTGGRDPFRDGIRTLIGKCP